MITIVGKVLHRCTVVPFFFFFFLGLGTPMEYVVHLKKHLFTTVSLNASLHCITAVHCSALQCTELHCITASLQRTSQFSRVVWRHKVCQRGRMLHEMKPWCSGAVQYTVYNSALCTGHGVLLCTVYSARCITVYSVQYTVYNSALCMVYGLQLCTVYSTLCITVYSVQ